MCYYPKCKNNSVYSTCQCGVVYYCSEHHNTDLSCERCPFLECGSCTKDGLWYNETLSEQLCTKCITKWIGKEKLSAKIEKLTYGMFTDDVARGLFQSSFSERLVKIINEHGIN